MLVALAAVAMVLLGRWQYDKHVTRDAYNATIAAGKTTAPAPVEQVLTTTDPPPDPVLFRTVILKGHYDVAHQVLARSHPLGSSNGLWVLAPLRLDSGPLVWVVRGWMGATGGARDVLPAPPLSSGPVTVTGRVFSEENDDAPIRPADLPSGQVQRADPVPLSVELGVNGPLLRGVVSATAEDPPATVAAGASALLEVPPPDLQAGPYLGYAGQWYLFSGMAIAVYFVTAFNVGRGRRPFGGKLEDDDEVALAAE